MIKLTPSKLDQAKLKRILQKRLRLVRTNLRSVLRDEALPQFIDKIMEGYDNLAARSEKLPEDPTGLQFWRSEFKDLLERDLAATFSVQGDTISVQIGRKADLGYGLDDPRSNQPLVWLVFYIEGLAGEWAFITPELYDQRRGSGAFAKLQEKGRFGQGFLISKESFFMEGWDSITSFESVKHPFSGFSPKDIFTEAVEEFNFRPFIRKAVEAALEGRKL